MECFNFCWSKTLNRLSFLYSPFHSFILVKKIELNLQVCNCKQSLLQDTKCRSQPESGIKHFAARRSNNKVPWLVVSRAQIESIRLQANERHQHREREREREVLNQKNCKLHLYQCLQKSILCIDRHLKSKCFLWS